MKKKLLFVPLLLGLLVACNGGNNLSNNSTTSIEEPTSEVISSSEETVLSSEEVASSEDVVVSEEESLETPSISEEVASSEDVVVSEEESSETPSISEEVASSEDVVVSEEEISSDRPIISEDSSESFVETNFVYFNLNGAVTWTNVNVYTWDANGTTLTGSWPGSAMEYDSELGYYKYDLGEITSCNVIFNNGTNQTPDMVYNSETPVYQLNSVGALGGVWTVVGEIVEVSSISYFMKGTFNGWTDGNPLTRVEGDKYTITLDLSVNDEFKFATSDWSWETTNLQGDAASNFSGGNGSNIVCIVAGNYTFELTSSSGVVTVTQNV